MANAKMNYSALAKSYNTLSYSMQLREILQVFCRNESFNNYSKFQLQERINQILLKYYEGEEILKYKIAKEFINKKYVAAFEVKAKNSRIDFLVINGNTKSFEVKSKIDSLKRLSKQAMDYGDVFEFNYAIVDQCHLSDVQKILPNYYGIWSFHGNKKIEHQEAKLSPNICSEAQLGLMNKNELVTFFNSADTGLIASTSTAEAINSAMKSALIKRYNKRWDFVKANWNSILPLDLQFFFNTNVQPDIVYA